MGKQVIRQPNGKLAIFSSFTDTLVLVDATRDDILDYFVSRATDDARRYATDVLDAVENDRPREVYYQFALSWEDALTMHKARGGKPLDQFREVNDTPTS